MIWIDNKQYMNFKKFDLETLHTITLNGVYNGEPCVVLLNECDADIVDLIRTYLYQAQEYLSSSEKKEMERIEKAEYQRLKKKYGRSK